MRPLPEGLLVSVFAGLAAIAWTAAMSVSDMPRRRHSQLGAALRPLRQSPLAAATAGAVRQSARAQTWFEWRRTGLAFPSSRAWCCRLCCFLSSSARTTPSPPPHLARRPGVPLSSPAGGDDGERQSSLGQRLLWRGAFHRDFANDTSGLVGAKLKAAALSTLAAGVSWSCWSLRRWF